MALLADLYRRLSRVGNSHLVAGGRHRTGARRVRPHGRHPVPARSASADGKRAIRADRRPAIGTARLFGPALRRPNADLGGPGPSRVRRHPGRFLFTFLKRGTPMSRPEVVVITGASA